MKISNRVKEKKQKRLKRHKRVRAKISGTRNRPRLSVFRSKKHIYAQLIDDNKGKVLVAVSDLKLKPKTEFSKGTKGKMKTKFSSPSQKKKTDLAKEVGKLLAKEAKNLKIEKVVFDRGGYKYHGRVKAVAEGAREEGIKF